MEEITKTRENRLRRLAERQGLSLEKSRRRDPLAIGFGGFMLFDGDQAIAGGQPNAYSFSLDDVESWLTGHGSPTGRNLDAVKRYAGRAFRNSQITLMPRSATCITYEITHPIGSIIFGISDDAIAVLEAQKRILSLEEIGQIVEENDLFVHAQTGAKAQARLILANMIV